MKREIFACWHNAGRSQMAAAFFSTMADPALVEVASAETTPGVVDAKRAREIIDGALGR
jgi:protein-tyrosine-phosphatase